MRDAEVFYRFSLRAPWGHAVLVGVLLGVLWFLAPKVWRRTSAERLASENSVAALQKAIALEPDRAEYRYQLGRIYLLSTISYDPEKARDSFRRAAELNPGVADYWIGLADAYDAQGRGQESKAAIATARLHDPRNPDLAWITGNIHATAGEISSALEAWRESLQGRPERSSIALDIGWKLAPDTKTLLDHLVPPDNAADFQFLDFLVKRQAGNPDLVWERIVNRGQPLDKRLAREYMNSLLAYPGNASRWHQRIETARQVWKQLAALSLAEAGGVTEAPETAGSKETQPRALLTNGGFEQELLDVGFAWRWLGGHGMALSMDGTVFQEGRRAVRLDFDGTQNQRFAGLEQRVPVEPEHRYRLSAMIRAEKIIGGSGLRLWVQGMHPTIPLPSAFGREVFHTSGWEEDHVEFTVPPSVYLLRVLVWREISHKFNPNISGTFWIDNVSLRDLGPARGDRP